MLARPRYVALTSVVGLAAAIPALTASTCSPLTVTVTTTMVPQVIGIPYPATVTSTIYSDDISPIPWADELRWRRAHSTAVSKTTHNTGPAAITIGAGYEVTAYADGNIVRAPPDCHGRDTYLGVKKFIDGKFDAGRCVETCREDKACHFANTWTLRKNGTTVEQHCALYSKAWPNAFLSPIGDDSLHVEASDSYGFTLNDGQDYRACVPSEV
ncbi:hypothetical protein IQ06DRAFT_331978 [Phaeosphaeriaceae sp. SRC1lsM3a]|nr:hypothetical protein IQ06DRAFT_331978 [Stagonospora sp. SRC1lsM3a]